MAVNARRARSLWWRAAGIALAAGLAGCALSAPPAEATLSAESGGSVLAALDAEAQAALQRSKQAPDDAAAAVAAAAVLFQAADLRLQLASLRALDAQQAPAIAAVLAADDAVGDPARTEILSLCTAGVDAAERALAQRPGDVASQLQLGLHLSLVAWANGPARSLFAGYGSRLVAAIDAAVAADPMFDHGAPLRLLGRFRGKAPWPYGDLPAATAALHRATEQAPIVINHLFLGDALWAAGERAAAQQQWRLALTAEADASTRWSADQLRELARRRLRAAD
jgi:hypothetical protein